MKWMSVNMALGFEQEGWQVFRYWQAAACRAAGREKSSQTSCCPGVEKHTWSSPLFLHSMHLHLLLLVYQCYIAIPVYFCVCVFFWDVCYVQMCCKSHAGNSCILWVFCRDVVGSYRWLKWVESSELRACHLKMKCGKLGCPVLYSVGNYSLNLTLLHYTSCIFFWKGWF